MRSVNAGYEEFMHAFGHHVGRKVHDGGSVLGPHWEKYGDLPDQRVEPNSIYAIELGVLVPGHGYIGVEENVLVTERRRGIPQHAADGTVADWLIQTSMVMRHSFQ